MKNIEYTSQFKRDAKKHYLDLLASEWAEVLNCLVNDISLPEKYRDHALKGDMKDYRDCHIKPDLVLLYKVTSSTLYLTRLGSHSELSLT
ncbi:type II toxin-antitoxin system YafQ family toxin [Pasteurellaceae bacterium LIM206]|nr:type II toxin-antitoxin system YafQ family toxin [Pasteurellaceae bacterium LIM206]